MGVPVIKGRLEIYQWQETREAGATQAGSYASQPLVPCYTGESKSREGPGVEGQGWSLALSCLSEHRVPPPAGTTLGICPLLWGQNCDLMNLLLNHSILLQKTTKHHLRAIYCEAKRCGGRHNRELFLPALTVQWGQNSLNFMCKLIAKV